jgi:hypothetical protein
MPFPYVVVARLGAKPLEPFGKGSNALKAGTRDAGPVRSYRAPIEDTAVRSAPGRGRAESRAYTRPGLKRKRISFPVSAQTFG